MIDNYDSFVHTLVSYLRELGAKVRVLRNDAVSAADVASMVADKTLRGLVISPGPKSPKDCGNCVEIVQSLAGRLPILGVCLGHQIIGHSFGATIMHGSQPMHGKVSTIYHAGSGLFDGLPNPLEVTRYHSLVVSPDMLRSGLKLDALSTDGAVMALSHPHWPVYGVQFHPEAVLTQAGHELLRNFISICDGWRDERVAV
jgi:para-aminobenzoate synthetase component 2